MASLEFRQGKPAPADLLAQPRSDQAAADHRERSIAQDGRETGPVHGVFDSAGGPSPFSSVWISSLVFDSRSSAVYSSKSVCARPLYLAEIAPAKWRGRLVAFFQINIVLGVLVAFFSNVAIDRIGFDGDEWRWKLGVEAVPAAAFLACLYFIPRSPRWLMLKGMRDEATDVMKRLRVPDVEGQIQAIQRSLHQVVHRKSEPLFVARHSRPIFLAIMVASFNQFGGINALWYYLNPILVSGGLSEDSGGMATILLGVANLIATVAGMVLIDKVGRRPLLLWGATGTLITMSMVAYIFTTGEATGLLVWLLTGVVICHAFGQGAVIWVYISEVFPNAVRAKGQTLGSFTHWFWAMVVSWTFPILAGDVGEPGAGLPFAFFAFMMILQIAVVFWLFPETKQVPLEDMETKVEKIQA